MSRRYSNSVPKHAKPSVSSKEARTDASAVRSRGKHVAAATEPKRNDRDNRTGAHGKHIAGHIEQVDVTNRATASAEAESPASAENTPSVARSAALMTIATLGSRVTGLLRTWAMAFALGNSVITSAYQVAWNLPAAIYDLAIGGLLGAAFIPVFMLQKERFGSKGANEFANNILNIAVVVLGAIALLATVFAPQVISTQTFTVGGGSEVAGYAVLFFRIFAIQILFYGVGGVITGILNANRVFFLPSVAPMLNNLIVIASFFSYVPLSAIDPQMAIIVLGVGCTIGVFTQLVIQIPAMVKQGFRFIPRINLKDPALVEALKIAVPTFIYIVGTIISFSCRNAFSLQAVDNGPSTLSYAWMWYQLPYGVIVVSLSRALFTEMSDSVAKEDWNAFRGHVKTGISTTLLLIIPLAGLMGVLSQPIMQLFRAGAFNSDDVVTVASTLSLWIISLPFYSVLMFLYNTFASMRKFMVFAVVSIFMVATQSALYSVLCSQNVLGLAGVPVADLIYYGSFCIIMLVILRKRVGSFGMGSIVWLAAKAVVAMAGGSGVAYGLKAVLPAMSGMLGGVIQLALCGLAGLIVSFVLCALFRIPEMEVVTRLLRRIFGKVLPSRKA